MIPPNTLINQRYRIIRHIAGGGMGNVYQACDENIKHTVALKQLVLSDSAIQQAFQRESHILAPLRHANLPRVSDYFSDPHGYFLVMEYIPGDDLGTQLAQSEKPFPPAQVLTWMDHLLSALDYMHQKGIIHRDIKPHNLKVSDTGEIILLDFGIAKHSHTTRSVLAATPGFASLEQMRGTGTDPRSDLYALAATSYCLLTTITPTDSIARLVAEAKRQPDPVQPLHQVNPQVPSAVSAVLMQAMALHIDDRPASAADLRQMLQQAQMLQPGQIPQVCPKCSAPLRTNKPYCPTCGSAFAAPLPQPPTQPASPRPPTQPASPPQFAPESAPPASQTTIVASPGPIVRRESPRSDKPKPRRLLKIIGVLMLIAVVMWSVWAMAGVSMNITDNSTATTHNEPATLRGHTSIVRSVAFSPDGNTLASASMDNTIKLWNIPDHSERTTLFGHTFFVTSVAFNHGSSNLASASLDNTIKLWDAGSQRKLATLVIQHNRAGVTSIAFSPDGTTLASAYTDNTMLLWDVTSESVAAYADNPVRLWDSNNQSVFAFRREHEQMVWSIAFSPDGTTLASASADQTIKLWDVASRRAISTFAGHTKWVRSVAFSPDGTTLASASADQTIKLWDVTSRRAISTLVGHTDVVESVAFSPDGTILASASADDTIKLWNVASQSELTTLTGHTDAVWSVAFSPDGTLLASASADQTIKLWEVPQ